METQKLYSSINWLCSGCQIAVYEAVVDDAFRRTFKTVCRQPHDLITFPEAEKEIAVLLVVDKNFPTGYRVQSVYVDQVFLTYEEAVQDCIRRMDELIGLLQKRIEVTNRWKVELQNRLEVCHAQ